MKKRVYIILLSVLVFCLILFAIRKKTETADTDSIYYMSENCEGKLESLSLISDAMLAGYDSLMIVAHPDDETIWGGAHLLEENYVVVCITNGNSKNRRREFAKVMEESHSTGIMLTYPDKIRGKRNNWDTCRDKIQENVDQIISKKEWNTVVTHNPDGEYGHIHHQMTSDIVTSTTQNLNLMDKLYYFGKYVKKKNMDKEEYSSYLAESLTLTQQKNKISLTELYPSQKKVMEHLGHMFPYENWIKANEWA